jgi:hypothetical protein
MDSADNFDPSDSWVAIDFETATGARDSACALGIARVCDGEVVSSGAWLIKPPGNVYDHWNIRVRGITPDRTAHAPSFAELCMCWRTTRDSTSACLERSSRGTASRRRSCATSAPSSWHAARSPSCGATGSTWCARIAGSRCATTTPPRMRRRARTSPCAVATRSGRPRSTRLSPRSGSDRRASSRARATRLDGPHRAHASRRPGDAAVRRRPAGRGRRTNRCGPAPLRG